MANPPGERVGDYGLAGARQSPRSKTERSPLGRRIGTLLREPGALNAFMSTVAVGAAQPPAEVGSA